MPTPEAQADTDSALLAFLHRAPIAMVQMAANGDVETLTPAAARWLLPLAEGGQIGNLVALLERWSPGLRQTLCGGAAAAAAQLCEDLRIHLPSAPGEAGEAGEAGARVLGLSVFKRDDGRLVAIFNDHSAQEGQAAGEQPSDHHHDHDRDRDRQRLTRATDAAGVGLFECHAASGVMSWNAQTYALHGRPDRVGVDDPRAVRDAALSAADRDRFEAWAQALQHGGERAIEFAAVWPDGTPHWLCARGQPQRDAAGGVASILGVMWDVSDRVKAQSDLRESEARYARALRGAADGLWEWDVRTGADYLSPRWKELLGFGPHELPDEEASFFNRIHPDDASLVQAAVQAHLQHGAPYDVELRLRTRNGDYRWFRSRGVAERDSAGQALRMAGSISDVHLRKQIEDELRDSQAKFSAMFSSVPVGIALTRLQDGMVIEVNAEFARVLGWKPADMVGFTTRELGVFTDGATRAALLAQVEAQGLGNMENLVMRHRSGRPVHAKLSAQPFTLGGQRLLISAITDLTDRHQAERALREQREAYAAMFNAASDAIVSTDAQGRVLLFNPAAERIFGHTAAQMLGQPIKRLLPDGLHPAAGAEPAALAAPPAGPRVLDAGRVQGRTASGRPLQLEASMSNTAVGGQTVLTAILRDVSERASAEARALRHRAELSALTQQLMTQEKETTQRLAQTLHDRLGQTLTAIRLTLDRSLLAAAAEASTDRRAAPRQLRELVDQAIAEVRQALTDLRPPQLDAEGLYAALDNELATRLALHPGVELLLDAAPSLQAQRWPAEVEYAVFMVAREAIDNALRHAGPTLVRLALSGTPTALSLEIGDDGVGLAADAERARPGHLGLIGMRERALAIGAALQLARSDEGGTRVGITWPAPG